MIIDAQHRYERNNMYGLECEYHFDSAHFLTDYYGKCENLHGHQWRVVASIQQVDLRTDASMRDMVLDFSAFKKAVRDICDSLDHTFLVEEGSLKPETIAALQAEGFNLTTLPFRTTAENLARYIFEQLAAQNLPVWQVEVDETKSNRAFYRA
jgi:6-pyruvoyltetrahydropterin/6-carboxytetrahydropterin synthase